MKEHTDLNEAVEEIIGTGTKILGRTPVSGGDINRVYRLELSDGTVLFMKANSIHNVRFFRAEAEGLQAMKQTGAVNVPGVLALGTDERSSFMLLEYIEEGRRSRSSSEKLGRALAGMHKADTGSYVRKGIFGFLQDNYIGAGEQCNTPKERWTEFFTRYRLIPQYRKASDWFNKEEHRKFDSMIGKMDQYLTEPKKPSLLHGDLWAGNYMIDREGEPWLIDPAVYVGHAEADLAMTELFGGFDTAFYDAYREMAGVDPGYRERRDLYNLYHLLNHLNLFGGAYAHSVRNVIEHYA